MAYILRFSKQGKLTVINLALSARTIVTVIYASYFTYGPSLTFFILLRLPVVFLGPRGRIPACTSVTGSMSHAICNVLK